MKNTSKWPECILIEGGCMDGFLDIMTWTH